LFFLSNIRFSKSSFELDFYGFVLFAIAAKDIDFISVGAYPLTSPQLFEVQGKLKFFKALFFGLVIPAIGNNFIVFVISTHDDESLRKSLHQRHLPSTHLVDYLYWFFQHNLTFKLGEGNHTQSVNDLRNLVSASENC